jgi:hypothetical protein
VSERTVLRTTSWLLNAALVAVCGFFVARIAGAVHDALERPPLEVAAATAATATPQTPRPWSDREVILTRNLFDTSRLVPPEPPPPPPVEEVEETDLPLGLVGTIASSRSEAGWAAVWNAQTRESVVLAPGDDVGDGLATVLRIERERVLLSEDGAIRELGLDDDQFRAPTKRPSKLRKRRLARQARQAQKARSAKRPAKLLRNRRAGR